MTPCSDCGAAPYAVRCCNGRQHFVIQHAEGACPRWYDVGGIFEDDACYLCPRPVMAEFIGPNPFE